MDSIASLNGQKAQGSSDINAFAGLGVAGLSGLAGKGAKKKLGQLLPLMQMLMKLIGGQQQNQNQNCQQPPGCHPHGNNMCNAMPNFGMGNTFNINSGNNALSSLFGGGGNALALAGGGNNGPGSFFGGGANALAMASGGGANAFASAGAGGGGAFAFAKAFASAGC
ncbi:MAG: hypothetical protein FJX76_24325 [Armatimonadetes bacterium]|nr:hypothetical protein [Armatimonadota bacterium]